MFLYTIKIILLFPKQFQFNLWIFQQIRVEFLRELVIKIYGQKFLCLEIFFLIFLLAFLISLPLWGIYGLWVIIFLSELYLQITVRKPKLLLFTPSWQNKRFDLKTSEINALSKQFFYNNDELMVNYGLDYIMSLELERGTPDEIWEMDNQPTVTTAINESITTDEFEEFFLDSNFIPPHVKDFITDEVDKDSSLVWSYFWFSTLPFICFLNLIVCVLLIFFGVPENWVTGVNNELEESRFFLDEYQSRMFIVLHDVWFSSWQWFIGGSFFSSGLGYFLKQYNWGGQAYLDVLENKSKYTKYIYYWKQNQSRNSFFFNKLFLWHTFFSQVKAFLHHSRQMPQSLRETFLYKYYLYDDFVFYKQLSELVDSDKNKKLSFSEKIKIVSWLSKKSQNWVSDYYFAQPAVNLYPDIYYSWLKLFKNHFVWNELTDTATWLQKIYWIFVTDFSALKESNIFFLEDIFLNNFNPEKYVQSLDILEVDSNLMEHGLRLNKVFSKYTNFFQNVDTYEIGHENVAVAYEDCMQLIQALPRRTNRKYKRALKIFFFYRYFFLINFSPFFESPGSKFLDLSYNVIEFYKYTSLIADLFNQKTNQVDVSFFENYFLYDSAELGLKKTLSRNSPSLIMEIIKYNQLFMMNGFPSFLPEVFEDLLERFNINKNGYDPQEYSLFDDFDFEDEDVIEEFVELTASGRAPYSQRQEKNFLHSFLHQANYDVLPELRYESTINQVQHQGLQKYLNRYDINKKINNRRDFLFNDLAQLYGYASSFFITLQKDHYIEASLKNEHTKLGLDNPLYNVYEYHLIDNGEEFFPLYAQYERQFFFNIRDFAKSVGFYYNSANVVNLNSIMSVWDEADIRLMKTKKKRRVFKTLTWVENLFQKILGNDVLKAWQFLDNLGTQQDLENNVKDLAWYKYYYKVDALLNYYDFMPSYRSFYIETWPVEYLIEFDGSQSTFLPFTDFFSGLDFFFY
jgi:hypothetical protein